MKQTNCVIALYKAHGDAEAAVKLLHKTGINMKQCSIVGQGYHTEEEVVGYYNAGDRMKFWGKEGAFWGGVWGLLFGSGVFWIPGIKKIPDPKNNPQIPPQKAPSFPQSFIRSPEL